MATMMMMMTVITTIHRIGFCITRRIEHNSRYKRYYHTIPIFIPFVRWYCIEYYMISRPHTLLSVMPLHLSEFFNCEPFRFADRLHWAHLLLILLLLLMLLFFVRCQQCPVYQKRATLCALLSWSLFMIRSDHKT